jgi:mitogen-activated protein kinase kinase kinase
MLISKLNHLNIIQYYGYKIENQNIYLYMEHMNGGSLSSMLKQYGQFDESLIKKFV